MVTVSVRGSVVVALGCVARKLPPIELETRGERKRNLKERICSRFVVALLQNCPSLFPAGTAG